MGDKIDDIPTPLPTEPTRLIDQLRWLIRQPHRLTHEMYWVSGRAVMADRRAPWMATASLQGYIHGGSAMTARPLATEHLQCTPTKPCTRAAP